MHLTLSQTRNFRLFQTERVCRRQFQIKWERREDLKTGRKHCGKRRNCSLRAISPFPTLFVTSNFSFSHIVFKRLVLQTRKNQGLFGKGLRSQSYSDTFRKSQGSQMIETRNKVVLLYLEIATFPY